MTEDEGLSTDRITARMQLAWGRTGLSRPDEAAAQAYLRQGWTPERVYRLLRLCEYARGVRSVIARALTDGGTAETWLVRRRMCRSAERAIDGGAPWDVVEGWCVVRAAEGDRARERWLRDGLLWKRVDDGDALTELAVWSQSVGPLAPFSWAAGLSMEEAREQAAAGVLEEAGLRTLAGLRGYALPVLD